jgi:hypothetical protein
MKETNAVWTQRNFCFVRSWNDFQAACCVSVRSDLAQSHSIAVRISAIRSNRTAQKYSTTERIANLVHRPLTISHIHVVHGHEERQMLVEPGVVIRIGVDMRIKPARTARFLPVDLRRQVGLVLLIFRTVLNFMPDMSTFIRTVATWTHLLFEQDGRLAHQSREDTDDVRTAE